MRWFLTLTIWSVLGGGLLQAGEPESCAVFNHRWTSGQAHFSINPNFPDHELSGPPQWQEGTILCAARAWHEQSRANFQFIYDGITEERGVNLDSDNQVNAISWVDIDGEDAFAATWVLGKAGETLQFDIVFFSSVNGAPINWSGIGDPATGTLDIGGIITHELGHALGLSHTANPESTMFGVPRQRGVTFRSLDDSDRQCIESVYGVRDESSLQLEILSVTPASGSIMGGEEVLIEGLNFTYSSETELMIGGKFVDKNLWEVERCDRIRILNMPSNTHGVVDIEVTNSIGSVIGAAFYEYVGPPFVFMRGDANVDGDLNISDALMVLGLLFLGSPRILDCDKSADANDSGSIDLADGSFILRYLFLGGAAPRVPFPNCDVDQSLDGLNCESYSLCE